MMPNPCSMLSVINVATKRKVASDRRMIIARLALAQAVRVPGWSKAALSMGT
jgi:hypothetical protein